MAYKHVAPKESLVVTPMDSLCGNPSELEGEGVIVGGEKGAPYSSHPETPGVIETVTYVEGTPFERDDKNIAESPTGKA